MSSPFDALENASTLGGVVVGAVMATLGSFAASWYERRTFRKEREADAALVFGELLRALDVQITVLRAAHARGDPFGQFTIRLARGLRREVEIYDRNRERLFLVRDASLRPEATFLMARLTFALDRIIDNTDALSGGPSDVEREELRLGRDQAFEFVVECAVEIPALANRFEALANTPLAIFDLARLGIVPQLGKAEANGGRSNEPPSAIAQAPPGEKQPLFQRPRDGTASPARTGDL